MMWAFLALLAVAAVQGGRVEELLRNQKLVGEQVAEPVAVATVDSVHGRPQLPADFYENFYRQYYSKNKAVGLPGVVGGPVHYPVGGLPVPSPVLPPVVGGVVPPVVGGAVPPFSFPPGVSSLPLSGVPSFPVGSFPGFPGAVSPPAYGQRRGFLRGIFGGRGGGLFGGEFGQAPVEGGFGGRLRERFAGSRLGERVISRFAERRLGLDEGTGGDAERQGFFGRIRSADRPGLARREQRVPFRARRAEGGLADFAAKVSN